MAVINYLFAAPVLLKVLVSLGFILLVNSFAKRLVVSIPAGTLLLAVWSGHSPGQIALIAWQRFSSADNLCLLAITFQVVWLSTQMASSGVMRDLVSAVRAKVPHRVSIAALPAIIGMLPMPGGAIFSAPLLADCDRDDSLDPLLKTQINYWFRHVWEYWWPLYPGVLLAIQITGLDIWQFMLVQLPLSALSVFAGMMFLLRKVPKTQAADRDEPIGEGLLKLLSPVLVVVLVYGILRVAVPELARLNRYLPMMIGLVTGTLLLQLQRPLKPRDWKTIVVSRKTITLAALVAIVRVYGAFIETRLPEGTLLVSQMRMELQAWGVPLLLIIVLIPFFSGVASGLAIGFVGASFPIVFSLLGESPSVPVLLSTTVLAYGFGYMGMILSPVHICLIVTNEHFKTRLVHSIVALIRPATVLLIGVLVYYTLLRLALGG
ncbi:MAG: DUF401 family protein [Candidatus Pacebacteria bacterium]|nr:DUF401 family protein [Candidatus Paceibacterota bacterium]